MSIHTTEFSHYAPVNARSFLTKLRMSLVARHQRAALGKLDDAALADIGLTRAQAVAEAKRPLWDVPANWRS